MSKFGELIVSHTLVMLGFSNDHFIGNSQFEKIIVDLAHDFKDKIKIIKIDPEKNPELCDALQIINYPHIMIYKNGKQMWHTSTNLKESTIINQINTLL